MTLEELRKKVCVFGYQPTTKEVSVINDLLWELKQYREGGVTEEILRRNNGALTIGTGCVIVSRHKDPIAPIGLDVCSLCQWTNIGLLNLGEPGVPKWVCHGCCKRMHDVMYVGKASK